MTIFITSNVAHASHFSFSTPPGKGPIEVRQAESWERDKKDPNTIHVSYWRTIHRFPKNQAREATAFAHAIYESEGSPTEVVMPGRRRTTLNLTRFST